MSPKSLSIHLPQMPTQIPIDRAKTKLKAKHKTSHRLKSIINFIESAYKLRLFMFKKSVTPKALV